MADTPLKTLLIIPSVDPAGGGQRIGLGGAERMTLNLCQHFDRSKVEPHLLLFHDPGPTREMLERHGVPVYLLRKRGRLDLQLWTGLKRLIIKERFDAVLSMLQGTNLHNLLVTPTVPGVACLISYRRGEILPMLARSEGRLAFRAQRLITPAKSVARKLAKQYRIDASRIIHIPNGCDSGRFPLQDAEAQQARRRELGLPAGALVLYTPSRIDQVKGQDIMAEALRKLRPQLAEHQVIWVNTGQCQDRALETRVRNMAAPFADHVRLLDATDRPADWYGACDLVVLPSRVEAFSNVLLESAFSGRQFIAAAVGETPDVVQTLGGGVLYDGSADILAEKLATLFKRGREALLDAGTALAAPARQHFSLERTAGMFAATIAGAVRERRAPRRLRS